MTVRETLLEIFENNRGVSFSGEELSERLGVSRNAVWKAIHQLKEDGYQISASKKGGYCFSDENDIFSPALIRRFLPENFPAEISVFDCVSSTNALLKQKAAQGAAEGTVVLARRQTEGKGRMGRPFYSPENTGLYLSLLLRPTISPEKSLYITTAAAAATAKAIETASGQPVAVKWVNDLFMNGKKCCGILTEASLDLESGGLEYAVLGIGVNLCPPERGFPAELEEIACGIFDKKPTEIEISRLAAAILTQFFHYYHALEKKEFLEEYRSRSLVTGKEITILSNSPEKGTALYIDEEFGLRVRTQTGEKTLRSGEVSVRLSSSASGNES